MALLAAAGPCYREFFMVLHAEPNQIPDLDEVVS